jgi:Zn-dependent M32 family carboxypeptidase
MEYRIDRPDHPYCRDINDGDCKNYKPKNIYDPMGGIIHEEMGTREPDT